MNLPDLEIRLQQLLDDELNADEFVELESELLENPKAMELYLSYSNLQSGLQHRASLEKSAKKLSVVPVEQLLAQQQQRAIRISLLSAAAIVTIVAGIMWLRSVQSTPDTLATVRVTSGSDYTLTHHTDEKLPPREVMAANSRIVLRHGVVELSLPHDVRAVIVAPADISLRDDRTLALDYGRAYFKVSSKAGQGFTVVTKHQQIVDLGTAFGIDSRNDSDEVELHVLEGRVRIDDKQGNKGEIIEGSRSVLLAGIKIKSEINDRPADFLSELPPKIDMVLNENFESGLLANSDYVIQIDDNLIQDFDGNNFRGIDDETTWKFTTTLPATIPIPVASYSYNGAAGQPSNHQPSGKPQGLFLDPGNAKLTDNHTGDSTGWASGTYVGFKDDSSPQVSFDLGAAHDIQTITVHSFVFDTEVKSIKISASMDGVTYSTHVVVSPEWSGLKNVSAAIQLPAWGAARFFRLDFASPGGWLFLGEVGFDAAPLPSSSDIPQDLEKAHPGNDPDQILSQRETTPPVTLALYPAENSQGAATGGQLKMVFNEPIKFGTGRFMVQNLTRRNESAVVSGSRQLSINGRTLSISPPTKIRNGAQATGWLAGWVTAAPVLFFNPDGNDTRYDNKDLEDKSPARGLIESMHSPGMVEVRTPIRREIGTISAGNRYTVSTTVGVRANDSENPSTFLGFTVRMSSGGSVLAQLATNAPPGSANSVSTVGFSWDASSLPDGIQPGDPLALEIIPNPPSDYQPGYLDLNAIRISTVRQTAK